MTDDTRLISTICPRIGRACPAAERMVRQLALADRCARGAAPEFEMTGSTRLDGCARTCPALFELSQSGVALYCGVSPDADPQALARFARAHLAGKAVALRPGSGALPLAFVLARAA
ncbi:MAG: B12-responsive protein of unknown function DUF1636 [Rhodobacteraceae bacterium HLUCCA12]|nr:MAG: B12-responsive protein of unknown function DUF1636 [Rhodobacteraceae bacterium HLUCCA12]